MITPRMLHRRRVRLRDATLEEASLFPYFDDAGRIRHHMLVWPASPRIVVFSHRTGILRFRLLRPIEIGESIASLGDLGRDRAADLAEFWHMDPWWVLSQPRFALHPAVPTLMSTNIPEHGPVRFDLRRGRVLGEVPKHEEPPRMARRQPKVGWRLRGWPWARRRRVTSRPAGRSQSEIQVGAGAVDTAPWQDISF